MLNEYQKADEKGQSKVLNQLEKIFSGYSYDITQHYVDNNTVDIDMSITGKTENNVYKYYLEAKDRNYTHTSFGGEWFLEENKLNELLAREGKSFYVNTFSDDWLIIWDLRNLDYKSLKSGWKKLPKTTLHPEQGKIWKFVYYLPTEKAVYSSAYI